MNEPLQLPSGVLKRLLRYELPYSAAVVDDLAAAPIYISDLL